MKKVALPKMQARAEFKPSTVNDEKRTITVIASTGYRGKRQSYWDGPYFEELGMDASNIRLGRFQKGANVLKMHDKYSLDSIAAVIERAWLENGSLLCEIRFSQRDEIEPLWQDVKDGIIRQVSVGYITHKLEKVEEVDEVPVYRATDWEPLELSFVTVAFDPDAQVRSAEENKEEKFTCQIFDRSSSMDTEDNTPAQTPASADKVIPQQRSEPTPTKEHAPVNLDEVRAQAKKEEKERVSSIRSACTKANMDLKFVDRMVDGDKSIDQVRELIIDSLGKEDDQTDTRSTNIIVGEDIGRTSTRDGIQAAIKHRVDRREKLDDNSKRFAHFTLLDMARESLRAAGNDVSMMGRMQVAKNALSTPSGLIRSAGYHSTSDFPLILENVLNKQLQMGYQRAPQTWRPFTKMTTVSDFKQVSRPRLGEFSELALIKEGGEYTHGKISEVAEKYAIKKYGRLIAVTWEMLVNDDLSAFDSITMHMGRKVADLESDIVWAILTANTQIMAEDNKALFHVGHNNLNEGGASAVDTDSLASIREAMRLHRDIDGTAPLNIFPEHMVVPAAREIEAQKILTSITPHTSGDVNLFGQSEGYKLSLGVEPRLDSVGTKPWFVFADSSAAPLIEAAQLMGNEAPELFSREGFDVDGIEWKIRYHFNAHAMDYRGMQRNNGV